jgi:hypothetical protein
MDCRTARLLLDFARPRCPELPPDEADALGAHLAGCTECDILARAERAGDARLAQAMRDVSVPEQLPGRILARLDTERGDRQRRRVGWTVRIAAAAAGIVLATWLGIVWYGTRTRPLDLEALHDKAVVHTSASAKKVEEWFKEDFGLTMTAPTAFNYGHLKDFGLASCQGRNVPKLYFARGDTEAHVYVVTGEQFDMEALKDAESVDSGGFHLEVVRDVPDHAFVVIYRGESLQPLLAQENLAQ